MSHIGTLSVAELRNASRHLLTCALLVVFVDAPLHAQKFQDLHDFNCATGGCGPIDIGHLTQGKDGNLYGTTTTGGTHGLGTIFKITPSSPAVYTDLYQFDGTKGANPHAGLTLASDGNFYGAAWGGGANKLGTVFRFTPPNTVTLLHSFGGFQGQSPVSPPVQGKDGNLYGVTATGSIYRVTLSSGKFTPLPKNAPGSVECPLYLASDGNLYGTTAFAGTSDLGTVFRLTTAGAVTIVHSFIASDGVRPTGPLTQAKDGNLYGTSQLGAANDSGDIFKITLAGKLTVLRSFDTLSGNTNNDGAGPIGGVVAASDGFLYGATYTGGGSGDGTLYQVTTGGIFKKLFDFTGTGAIPGANPYATLMQHTNGTLYGVTNAGTSLTDGDVFSITPANPLLTLIMEGPIFLLPGVPVQILGNNLEQVFSLSFAGVQAQFKPGSNTFLTATVPMNAVDGFVTATFPTGLQIQTQSAVHILPKITNLDPSSGPVGAQVGIVGGGFATAVAVTFGGVKATTFRVASPSLIQATVPVGAKTGKVGVTTHNGTAISTETFTVN